MFSEYITSDDLTYNTSSAAHQLQSSQWKRPDSVMCQKMSLQATAVRLQLHFQLFPMHSLALWTFIHLPSDICENLHTPLNREVPKSTCGMYICIRSKYTVYIYIYPSPHLCLLSLYLQLVVFWQLKVCEPAYGQRYLLFKHLIICC